MVLIKFAAMVGFWQSPGSHGPLIAFDHVMLRLTCAAALGGILGLEREIRRKSAGLRTNMFLCVGSALFTVVSNQLAVHWGGDPTRVASYVVAGIGFIGGGAILHQQGSVRGMTTAATLFVVSAIGMACGGGFYREAGFTTGVVLVALYLLGMVEKRSSVKHVDVRYELVGDDEGTLMEAVNLALEDVHKMVVSPQVARARGRTRMQFVINATRSEHRRVLQRLRELKEAQNVLSLGQEEAD